MVLGAQPVNQGGRQFSVFEYQGKRSRKAGGETAARALLASRGRPQTATLFRRSMNEKHGDAIIDDREAKMEDMASGSVIAKTEPLKRAGVPHAR